MVWFFNGSVFTIVHMSKEERRVAKKKTANTGIPGLSFSWKRALGVTAAKQRFARKTGIPTTKAGLERKIGRAVLNMLDPAGGSKKNKK